MKDGEQAQRRRLDRIPIWKEGEPLPEPTHIQSNPAHDATRNDFIRMAEENNRLVKELQKLRAAAPIPTDVDAIRNFRDIDAVSYWNQAKTDKKLPKAKDYAPSSENELTQSVSLRVWIAKMINGMTLDELGFVRAAVDLVLKEKRK
jgi:hypothetical protein